MTKHASTTTVTNFIDEYYGFQVVPSSLTGYFKKKSFKSLMAAITFLRVMCFTDNRFASGTLAFDGGHYIKFKHVNPTANNIFHLDQLLKGLNDQTLTYDSKSFYHYAPPFLE